MAIFSKQKIAKNSKDRIDLEMVKTINMEEKDMSKVTNAPVEEEPVVEEPKKAPAAKKPAAKKEEKKPNIFKRAWNAIVSHKKDILIGATSAVAGAGITYGVGKYGEYRANKAMKNQVPRQEETLID